MPETHAPYQGAPAFDCPYDGAFADQTWYTLWRSQTNWTPGGETPKDLAPSWDRATPPERYTEPDRWTQAQCRSCGKFSTWRGSRLIYPAKNTLPQPHDDCPEAVAALYDEARSVVPVSRRAGAALARATLELLLRTLLEDSTHRLIDLIDQVEPLVSVPLADMLSVVRHAGNTSLHVSGVPDDLTVLVLDEASDEVIIALFTTINEVTDELITRPARAARLLGKAPESFRDNLARLRAKRQQ